jgi:hypothetical protein
MLPRIDAEEAITTSNRIGVGSGTLTPEARERLTKNWERKANPGRGARAARATPEVLHAHGIGTRRVPKKAQPNA